MASTPRAEFYVPLATTEGTLIASYNRGMRLLYEAGGVTTTAMDDRMQRTPAFVFPSAREARAFGDWPNEHFEQIKEAAEATTCTGRLQEELAGEHPAHARQTRGRRGDDSR